MDTPIRAGTLSTDPMYVLNSERLQSDGYIGTLIESAKQNTAKPTLQLKFLLLKNKKIGFVGMDG